MNKKPIRVMIIDDSAVIRQIVSEKLNQDPQLSVISTAMNPISAERKISRDNPDVIVLDLEMPRMDGLSFLKVLRQKSAIPVVIFSAYGKKENELATRAMQYGALAVVSKPQGNETSEKIKELARVLKKAVRFNRSEYREKTEAECLSTQRPKTSFERLMESTSKIISNEGLIGSKIIAIGASTGGTEAIRDVLRGIPQDCPPILSVIHMPKEFTCRFAERLNALCSIDVKEAENGEILRPGLALIAPGDHHLVLMKDTHGYRAYLQDSPPVMRHRPSVEVLFQSVASAAKFNALGILLTGMGADGAEGLNQIHRSGGYTIAQDEKTCVVFGMPNEAIKRGGVDSILALDQIPKACVSWMNGALNRSRTQTI